MFGISSYIDTLPDTVDAHRIKASIIASHGVDGGGIATEMVVHSFSVLEVRSFIESSLIN